MKNLDILLVSLTVIAVSTFGTLFTMRGEEWYQTLALPSITPPSWVFGIVWTTLYVMCGCAALILIRSYKHTYYYYFAIRLLLTAAVLNITWSYLFFVHHSIAGALIDCIVIEFIFITLLTLTWQDARTVALLLLPSALWIAFAVVINYQILLLN